MKKYYLDKVEQNGKYFYVLIANPRVIVQMITRVDPGEEQKTQRPWNEGRVKEIAKYVTGKFKDDENKKAIGLIPNAPILNIKKGLEVKSDKEGTYIMLPETKEEFKKYANTMEAIDGQHRIRAFMEEYIDPSFSEKTKYEMVFTLFDRIPEKEKREIFMITNEKQVKVPGNLLRLFKRELDLLKGDEEVYDLVVELNNEDFSPLKGRIMIGAQRINKGYQESQLSKIINNSETYKVLEAREFDRGIMAKIIANYLNAWEKVYDVSYQDPGKETVTKISGLRYTFYLFPACLEILGNRKKPASVTEFKKIVDMLPDATGVDDVFTDQTTNAFFRGESATVQLAKDHVMRLKAYEQQHQNNFDISAGI